MLEPGAGDSELDVAPAGPTQRELYEAYESERPPERKQPSWYYLDRFPVYENSHTRAKQVVCEPCRRGGGPKDCIRPCVAQGHGTLPASDQPPGATR